MSNFSAIYNLMTVREIQEKYPYIQWLDYLNALLPSPLSVDENEIVIVMTPDFFAKLGTLLNETPARAIANYMMWRVTRFSLAYLTNDVRKREMEFSKTLSGQKERESRWKECVTLARQRYGTV